MFDVVLWLRWWYGYVSDLEEGGVLIIVIQVHDFGEVEASMFEIVIIYNSGPNGNESKSTNEQGDQTQPESWVAVEGILLIDTYIYYLIRYLYYEQ